MEERERRGSEMSLTARVYIALVVGVGTATLIHGLFLWSPQDLPRFFCYLLLAIPASCLKVALPGVNTGTMSVLFLFLLAGVVELDLAQTLIIGVSCTLIQSFWHSRWRVRAVQVVFSTANLAFAIAATHAVYHWPLLLHSFFQAPVRLAIAVSVLFVSNTLPVAV